MKLFPNFNELWQYLSYCPICNEKCRSLTVSDTYQELIYSKTEDSFSVFGTFPTKDGGFIQEKVLEVNVLTGDILFYKNILNLEKNIIANCKKCFGSFADGKMMRLNEKCKIDSFIVSTESMCFLNPETYHITLIHTTNTLLCSKSGNKLFQSDIPEGISFSDKDKLTAKLKTLILFS